MPSHSSPASARSLSPRRGSFVAFPQTIVERFLWLDLTRRELVVLLLVARLTYGCRNEAWASLRQADLAAVGIGANHAKEVLTRLLERGLLIQEGDRPNYRLGNPAGEESETTMERRSQLARLVSRQLARSQSGKTRIPKQGTEPFPKREETHSVSGNLSTGVTWQFSRSEGQFVKKNAPPIDNYR